jgi:hypothetical protein
VARLMKDSKDAAEAAERIMQLCVARDQGGAGAGAAVTLAASGPVSAMSGRKTSAMKKEVGIFFLSLLPLPMLTSLELPRDVIL